MPNINHSVCRRFFSLLLLLLICGWAHASGVDTLKTATFGKVVIYKPLAASKSFIILVSGNEGWNGQMAAVATREVAQGALVLGIDLRHYVKKLKSQPAKCCYPAGDFEELSMMLQKKYKLNQYFKPILVGYSAGSSWVYGALAQAPANTFKGAIALAFSPDVKVNKPLCKGSGLKQLPLKTGRLFRNEPCNNLTAPFIILQGANDKVCKLEVAQQFISGVNTGKLVVLPHDGHQIAQSAEWFQQFTEASKSMEAWPTFAEQKAARNALPSKEKPVPLDSDFPVIPIPTAGRGPLPMVFLISGDGGWTSFDNSLAEALAAKGMPVLGLDAQKYFWNEKTPIETATAVAKAVEHYMQQWDKKTFILAGYSFGAGVVPFIADRLPAELKTTLSGVYSLSPDETADFEIHISDMLDLGTADDQYKVADEIKKIKQFHPMCIFGNEESEVTRTHLGQAGARILTVPGNHHYNDNPAAAADLILKDIEKEQQH